MKKTKKESLSVAFKVVFAIVIVALAYFTFFGKTEGDNVTKPTPTITTQVDTVKILKKKIKIHIKVFSDTDINKTLLRKTESYLNNKFDLAQVEFDISGTTVVGFPYINAFENGQNEIYKNWSDYLDVPDTIGIWVIANDEEMICSRTEYSVSCSRSGGWSYVNNSLTRNVVVSTFDFYQLRVTAHELGHFFGLYHTFEESFGKDDGSGDCEKVGDLICDTPPDPSSLYEIYVDYQNCEMKFENYKPMLNNMMAYYKPCVGKDYEFTQGQLDVVKKNALRYEQNKKKIQK